VNPELRKIEEDNLSTSSCSELQLNSFVKREETAEGIPLAANGLNLSYVCAVTNISVSL